MKTIMLTITHISAIEKSVVSVKKLTLKRRYVVWWLLWRLGKWVEPRTPKLRAKAEEIVRECSSEEVRELAAALHQQTQSGVVQWEWSGWSYAHPSFGGVVSGFVDGRLHTSTRRPPPTH